MTGTLRVDGSLGEGGGQMLRTALSLAALLERPVELFNIRAKRKMPGLRPQHLTAVKALAKICGAELHGAHVNSTELFFAPQTIQGGHYRFDIGTAGAVSLVFAAVLPPLLFTTSPSKVMITGGTHVPFSPPFHYIDSIFLPALGQMGGQVAVTLRRWGWYPKGGGEIEVDINPCRVLLPFQNADRGELNSLRLLVGLSNLPFHIAEREATYVKDRLAKEGYGVDKRIVSEESYGQGNMVFLLSSFGKAAAGFSALGKKGRPAEKVAEDVCRQWFSFESVARATVDLHLADQLVLYMALAAGKSFFVTERITEHLQTNINIIEQFLPVCFEIDPRSHRVRVEGITHIRSS